MRARKTPEAGVLGAVNRDLRQLALRDAALADSALAESARALARKLDDPETSATAAAACAKALREALDRLRELAPAVEETDWLSELQGRA